MVAFGKKSTAEEVAAGKDMSGKTIIITGGSSGMGLETVKVLAKAGGQVLLCCRNIEAGKKAAEGLEVSYCISRCTQCSYYFSHSQITVLCRAILVSMLWIWRILPASRYFPTPLPTPSQTCMSSFAMPE